MAHRRDGAAPAEGDFTRATAWLTTSRQAAASGMARTVLRQVEKPRERVRAYGRTGVRAYGATTTRRPPVVTF
ncbi:hypothetical protein [Streptomyces rimosus]|uniref:hypothetical protein n=1 Tax=Streptomyces rimosus TaxID=1927 RepID=UPI00131B1C37|nr:hypothetical protein [Streptomyces rimosus]